jgi:hypothetical protein
VDVRAALLHDLGMVALDLGDPVAAAGYLEQALGAADQAGDLHRGAEVVARLAQAARAAGDRAATERWRAGRARADFLAAVARTVDRLLPGAGVAGVSGLLLGDTGKRPETLKLPGGRVSEGLLWRRRLGAEVRRGAPQGRVALVVGGVSDRLEDVLRSASGGGRTEVLRLLLVERDRVEERVARVERGEKGLACERWVPVPAGSPGELTGQRLRLVQAVRAALA